MCSRVERRPFDGLLHRVPGRRDLASIVGDLVVVGSDDGQVYFVDAASGGLEGAFPMTAGVGSAARPTDDGSVVVGGADDRLYSLAGFAG